MCTNKECVNKFIDSAQYFNGRTHKFGDNSEVQLQRREKEHRSKNLRTYSKDSESVHISDSDHKYWQIKTNLQGTLLYSIFVLRIKLVLLNEFSAAEFKFAQRLVTIYYTSCPTKTSFHNFEELDGPRCNPIVDFKL